MLGYLSNWPISARSISSCTTLCVTVGQFSFASRSTESSAQRTMLRDRLRLQPCWRSSPQRPFLLSTPEPKSSCHRGANRSLPLRNRISMEMRLGAGWERGGAVTAEIAPLTPPCRAVPGRAVPRTCDRSRRWHRPQQRQPGAAPQPLPSTPKTPTRQLRAPPPTHREAPARAASLEPPHAERSPQRPGSGSRGQQRAEAASCGASLFSPLLFPPYPPPPPPPVSLPPPPPPGGRVGGGGGAGARPRSAARALRMSPRPPEPPAERWMRRRRRGPAASAAQHSAAQHRTEQHSAAQHGSAQHGTARPLPGCGARLPPPQRPAPLPTLRHCRGPATGFWPPPSSGSRWGRAGAAADAGAAAPIAAQGLRGWRMLRWPA